MIAAKLKEFHRAGEAVTMEFVGLMRSTFAYYGELNALFQEKLPANLYQSELVAVLNSEIKPRLFNHAFCERIQDALKALRRAILRLEDLRDAQPDLPEYINNLEGLAALAERLEALYQRHWEYYRYQNHVKEEELVAMLMEVDRVGHAWDVYQAGFGAARELVGALSGQPLGEGMAAVRIAYQRPTPQHFSVETLTTLMDFLESCYRFICAVHDLEAEQQPLTITEVVIGEPVELQLAVPEVTAEAYRRFLQYLFLKDMLQRDALLKFVMESITREYRHENAAPLANKPAMQKDLAARLKALPTGGRFTIADRTFPDDGVKVMHEFFVSLEQKRIAHETLLQAGEKARRKVRKAEKSPVTVADGPLRPRESAGEAKEGDARAHIRMLTEPGLDSPISNDG